MSDHVYVIESRDGHYVQAVRLTEEAARRYADSCPYECTVESFRTEDIDHWENFKRIENGEGR